MAPSVEIDRSVCTASCDGSEERQSQSFIRGQYVKMRFLTVLLVLALAFLAGHAALAEKSGMDDSPIVIESSTDVWIQRGLEILVIVLGLLIAFAGYRLFKVPFSAFSFFVIQD